MFRKKCNQACHFIGFFFSPFIILHYLVEELADKDKDEQKEGDWVGLICGIFVEGRRSFFGARIQSNLSQDQHFLLSDYLVKHFWRPQ